MRSFVQFSASLLAVFFFICIAKPVLGADDLSTPTKAAEAFANALCSGDSAHVRQLVVASPVELEVLDQVAAYFKALAVLKAAGTKLGDAGALPADMAMSPDLAALYSAEKEQIDGASATLSTGQPRFGQGIPTLTQKGGQWIFDVAASTHNDSRLKSLAMKCAQAIDPLTTASKKISDGSVTSMNDALTPAARAQAGAINRQLAILFTGTIPGMPSGVPAGLPGAGFRGFPAGGGGNAPDLSALIRAGAPPGALDKATQMANPPTAASPPPGFAVPTAGPMVQAAPVVIDLSHQDLPGPDPRYTSWQGAKVGDYCLYTVKTHVDANPARPFDGQGGDQTVTEMDYLYAVDTDGVMVLTLTSSGGPIPPASGPNVESNASGVIFTGRFEYYSATAINPADGPLLSGLKSGQDAPSPVAGGNLGSCKTFTLPLPPPSDATLGVWANPKVPGLMAMSVQKNKNSLSLRTLVACHRSGGESWADTNSDPDLGLMLEIADPDKGPKIVSFNRIRDGWVGKYDIGMKADNPLTEAKNVSFSIRQFVLVEKDEHKKTIIRTTVDYTMAVGARTLRNARRGHWMPWHAVHPDIDPGILETIDFQLVDHGFQWVPDGGRASGAFKGVPVFRPAFHDFVKPADAATAVAWPDAALPPVEKRDGSETDHWGNFVTTDTSSNDEDQYLADHLNKPLIKPKRPLAKYGGPQFGCTFEYLKDPSSQIGVMDKNLARLSSRNFSFGDETFEIAAQPIYPGEATPSLDGEYQSVLDQHKNDPSMLASHPAKVRVAGLDGYAFTIDARDKDGNDVRTVEVFALAPHRKFRVTFFTFRPHAEQAWNQLRFIMDSVKLED